MAKPCHHCPQHFQPDGAETSSLGSPKCDRTLCTSSTNSVLLITTQGPGIEKDSPVCTAQSQRNIRPCGTSSRILWGTGLLTIESPQSPPGPLVAVHLGLTWERESLQFLQVVLSTTPSSLQSLPLACCFPSEDRPEQTHWKLVFN